MEIECKNPASFSENWFDAYRQIKDYEKTVPELYKYVQIGIAAEQNAMYFPIIPWQEEIKVNQWKEEGKDSIDSAIEMLSKDIILDIIRNFMFFRVEMGNATKVIARYMQYRAARKIVNRVSANLEGEDEKNKVEEGVKKRLNAINMFLENPKRIELIAKDIAEHFKENVDGTFKAMVVAASRRSCAYYKEDEYPKILIVTDMLLTGFDAPILQTMYLDKPLKEHRLLQAIARTNRPYKGIKEAGVILDYIGILKEFKRAFELYSEEEIKGVLSGIESLREDFNILLDSLLAQFCDIPKDSYDRQCMSRNISKRP